MNQLFTCHAYYAGPTAKAKHVRHTYAVMALDHDDAMARISTELRCKRGGLLPYTITADEEPNQISFGGAEVLHICDARAEIVKTRTGDFYGHHAALANKGIAA